MGKASAQTAALAPPPDMQGGIVKRTVKEMISDKLASLIASGALQVGDDLPSERELAQSLSVSRESVRGAIQELALRGMVEVSQGARTRIVSAEGAARKTAIATPDAINRYDLDSVHQARLLVEQALIADAAARIDAEALARLEASLAAQRECLDDPVRFLICDREFHTTIYRAAANPLLSDFVIGLYDYLMDHRRVAVSQPGAILRSYKDHLDVVAGLRARSPAKAVAAFNRHIERIYVTTRSILDQSDQDSTGRRLPGKGRAAARSRPTPQRRGHPSDKA